MRSLSSLSHGDHVCAIYDTPQEQMPHIAAYVRRGVEDGERCVYIVDDRAAEDVLGALREAGLHVDDARVDQRLLLLTKRDSYLQRGRFDPDAMIWTLSAITDQAVADGCQSLRVAGEMTWALGAETGCDRLLEYETKLNLFFPGSRASAICQYNRSRFSPEMLREVLRRHPFALVGGQLSENPYYEPPGMVRAREESLPTVQDMLARLAGQ